MADSNADDAFARIRAAREKAWWRDQVALVGPTDVPLAVLGPRGGATEQEMCALGAALARWRAEYPPARHIWGLSDLLAGRRPRTPFGYLGVPLTPHDCENGGEPVALVYVAAGTDLTAAATELTARLSALLETCAWITDPDTYSYMNR